MTELECEDDGDYVQAEGTQLPKGVVEGSGEKDDIYRGLVNAETRIFVKKTAGRFEDCFQLVNNPQRPVKENRSATEVKILCNDDNW